MNDYTDPYASTRPVHEVPPRRTRGGLAAFVGFAALFPLTLYALAHPAVAAATLSGIVVGLLAGSLRRRLTRRPTEHRSSESERPSTAFGRAATRE